ncbi:MAG TPA: serine/threonine-protein kinase, partial [Ktedonobacteraceae bacterium]|nr:serine/threonine-protein kinase [Ktedonobacteraceae bacterium]
YGEGNGALYLVTPFIATGSLADLLQRVGGRLSALQALPIVQQLCSAVQYAHEHNTIHGNLKPTNVLIGEDGRLLLCDFGIVRDYDDSQQSLTQIGWSSAEYAAPEQSLGIVRRATDIYSLGVLLFAILSGTPPFTGQTPVAVLLKHVRQFPPSARSLVPSISESVDEVLAKALQKHSEERFASAQAFGEAFQKAVMVAPVASPFAITMPPRPVLSAQYQPPVKDHPQPAEPFFDPAIAGEKQFGPLSSSRIAPRVPETPVPGESIESGEASEPDMTRGNERGEDGPSSPEESFEWSPEERSWDDALPPRATTVAHEYLSERESPPHRGELVEGQESGQDADTINEYLRRWLPLIILLLLLLGILVALASAVLFPET